VTNGTRTIIQYVAVGLFALFTVGMLAVFIFDNIVGKTADLVVVGYLATLSGAILSLLGVNIGSSTTAYATDRANLNTAAVVAAANGTAGTVAKAHLGMDPAAAPSDPQGGVAP
jgi:hypothetical protein